MGDLKPMQNVPTKPNGCFLDYTYCASPNCQNVCGRKMSNKIRDAIKGKENLHISWADFCGSEGIIK